MIKPSPYPEVLDLMHPSLEVVQSSFSGGMNLMGEDTKIAINEYRECFNLFNRFDRLTPVNDSKEIGLDLAANKQGTYAVGQYIVTFAGGNAYYKRFNSDIHVPIVNFRMSVNAKRIYACLVPISYINIYRKLQVPILINSFDGLTVNNPQANPNNSVTTFGTAVTSASPQCLVCQDNTNTPFIIYLDPLTNVPKCRQLQTYDQWKLESAGGVREFVPIGSDMLYFDGVLYCVSTDGKFLNRSVTGRPLDFVINVKFDGDKGGDETTTNYGVGYGIIRALWVASGQQGFNVTTENNSTINVIPNKQITEFGEPTFDRAVLFGTGPLNSFSVIDVVGDTAFIDAEGIKSYNAAKQGKTESNNSIFSLKISSLFEQNIATGVENIIQDKDSCAATVFNGYALFSVLTIYGNVIVVFDTYLNCWACMLRLTNVQAITQFANLLPNARKLYGITSDNRMFDIFGSTAIVEGEFTTKAFANESLKIEQKTECLHVVISKQNADGVCNVTAIIDEDVKTPVNKTIRKQNKINKQIFVFTYPSIGFKIAYNIKWTGAGALSYIMHIGTNVGGEQSQKQISQIR